MRKAILIISLCLFLAVGCSEKQSPQPLIKKPGLEDDGLAVGTLEEVGINANLAASLVAGIKDGKYGEVHSVLIYRKGKLVLEEYFPGHNYQWDGPGFHGRAVFWSRYTKHNVHSVGKSITSACVGIAIDRGFITSVHDPIFDYLPDYKRFAVDGKEVVTIENLLTMTSGLQWDEWGASYDSGENDLIKLWLSCEDPIACILERPLASEPGTAFNYSGGDLVLLGEIVKNATGMDIETFSWAYLFEPMGIDTPSWSWIGESGVVYAGGDQLLTPREMLKFGVTYLDGGVWDGQQIIPAGWVSQSRIPYITWFNNLLKPKPPGDTTWGRRGYAYNWWTHEFSQGGESIPSYYALGWGGQKIYVFPGKEAVVVFTGGNYTSRDTTDKLLTRFVLPAFN